jgi:hypothetical protein
MHEKWVVDTRNVFIMLVEKLVENTSVPLTGIG